MDAQCEGVIDGGLEVSKYTNQGHPVLSACTMGELRQVLDSEEDVRPCAASDPEQLSQQLAIGELGVLVVKLWRNT